MYAFQGKSTPTPSSRKTILINRSFILSCLVLARLYYYSTISRFLVVVWDILLARYE
jgi:hypothetical protein